MLSLVDVCKQWGEFRIEDITLELVPGELFVLLGPSGAGKSLLLELIAGFHAPGSGVLRLADRDLADLPPERRRIGVVFQDHMLFPHMDVRRNITYGLRARGEGRQSRRAKVRRLVDMLGLGPLLERHVAALSGGERQRVALARALAVEPDLLLLDEPFCSLDPPVRHALWDELKDLQRTTATTCMLVTHDRAEALHLGERIGVMRDGRLVQVGTGTEVFESPANRFVAEFTGGTNVHRGHATADGDLARFRCGALEIVSSARVEGPCCALVRPEHIILSRQPFLSSARNKLRGVVHEVRRRGGLFFVTADFSGHKLSCALTPRSLAELDVEVGSTVYFCFKASNVHLFQDTQFT